MHKWPLATYLFLLFESFKLCSYQNAHNICQKQTISSGSMWNILKPPKHSMEPNNRGYTTFSPISVISITIHCSEIPRKREWLPTPVFLLGESHGQRSLVGYSPWCHKELNITEWLTISLFYYLRKLGNKNKEKRINISKKKNKTV